jgi:hypothetical protein
MTSAAVEVEWLASRSCSFTPGKIARPYPLDRRLVGPKTGLDENGK